MVLQGNATPAIGLAPALSYTNLDPDFFDLDGFFTENPGFCLTFTRSSYLIRATTFTALL
jgi:hypothetical protein